MKLNLSEDTCMAAKPGTIIAVAVEVCDGCEGDPDKSITCFRCHDRGVRYRPLDRWGVVTKNDIHRALSIIERHTGDDRSPLTDRLKASLSGVVQSEALASRATGTEDHL